jgi:ribosomal-protein-alanine N-acetyltransferase
VGNGPGILFIENLKHSLEKNMFSDSFSKIPEIKTDRLLLRSFGLEDIPAYRIEFEKESIQKYLGGVLVLKDNVQDATNWLRNINDRLLKKKLVFTWLITKKYNPRESVGRIDLGGFTNKKAAEISYYIWEKYWGNGYAVEAIQSIIEYGFVNLELERIQALIDIRNSNSEKVVGKAGFKKEGLLRKYPLGKSITDVYIYSMIRQEYSSDRN